ALLEVTRLFVIQLLISRHPDLLAPPEEVTGHPPPLYGARRILAGVRWPARSQDRRTIIQPTYRRRRPSTSAGQSIPLSPPFSRPSAAVQRERCTDPRAPPARIVARAKVVLAAIEAGDPLAF